MTRRPARIAVIASLLVGTLALGAGAGAIAYSTVGSSDPTTVVRQVTVPSSEPAVTGGLTVGQIYRGAYKGVVEITTTTIAQNPFGGQGESRAQGSGFVYDADGHIVTNEHVVDSQTSVSVRFWNGKTYDAKVVGSDKSTDLAVIKVNAPASLLHPLTVGDSSAVQVGDGAVAIGSPFGLEETVTSGIVSALHRQMRAPNNFTINDSIQTDAAINHGNSGGPLLNARGEVIGVNAQIAGDTGANVGIGFAIPSNTVGSIADKLIGTGKVEHAFLGVTIQPVPASIASELKTVTGVEVVTVRKATPAAEAGLKAATGQRVIDGETYPTGGDVITEVDGQKITTAESLQRAVDSHSPGDTITITYWRSGDTKTVDVKLANRPS